MYFDVAPRADHSNRILCSYLKVALACDWLDDGYRNWTMSELIAFHDWDDEWIIGVTRLAQDLKLV
jgi:hypothetical protein